MTLLDSLIAHPAPIREDADGVLRVGNTRVRLASVLSAFKTGSTPEEIVLKYPSLDLTDVYATITYYLWHREEVDPYLDAAEKRSIAVQDENQSRLPNAGLRQRLEDRRQANA